MQYLQPSFFIIGERKCATSTLYRYLLDHPQILPCRVKEPQFFSKPWWYRMLFKKKYLSLFPVSGATGATIEWLDLDGSNEIKRESLHFRCAEKMSIITGEASANTFSQVPPARLQRMFPSARLILCLRHPVDRGYSHYQMLRRFADEGRRLPLRLKDFRSDFITEMARVGKGGTGYFAGPGLYTERLRQWSEVFGRDAVFIVRTEDLSDIESRKAVLHDLCAFLRIADYDFNTNVSSVNVSKGLPGLNPELRKTLFQYYSDDIASLEEFTGRKFYWNP